MGLNNLKPVKGATKKPKRIGRGTGSGHGGTSTKGHKGQKARSGGHVKAGFEGGQMPLQRRVPKRGFKSLFRVKYTIVHIEDLVKHFEKNATVDMESMKAKGLIRSKANLVKVLSDGEITIPLSVKAHHFSKKAEEKIVGSGGRIEVIK